MKKIVFFLFVIISLVGQSQIVVDETLTTQQLVQDLLIGSSSCAIVSNFTQSTGTDFGDVNGIGAFNGNGSAFPFASGVVLSSGNVANAPGPNPDTGVPVLSNGGFGWLGDADLENAVGLPLGNTNNASFIEFDFVPFVSQITFDFIMASEEYNENFECTFSDAFAFILTDNVLGTVTNLAVLPGTTTPIQVTNIRENIQGQCAAVNPQFYGTYNFTTTDTTLPFIPGTNAPINFNGQTVELTAIGDVIVGNNYTIKLVVADDQDTAFDIAVFLEAGSFNIGSIDLGVDLTTGNGNARCDGEPFEIVPMLTAPASTTFEWRFENPLGSGNFDPFVPAETGPTLVVNQTGNYQLNVTVGGVCDSSAELFVEFATPPVVTTPTNPLIGCDIDNDGFFEFDLTQFNPILTGNDPDLMVSYHGTLLNAQDNILPLPLMYVNDTQYNDSVFARVESITSSCATVVEVFLEVRDTPAAVAPSGPLRECDDDIADGFTFFDLTLVEPEVLSSLDPSQYDFYYYEQEMDAQAALANALLAPDFSLAIGTPANYLNSTPFNQVVYILLVGNGTSMTPPNPNGAEGCGVIFPLELIVDPRPEDFGPFELMLCDDDLNGSTLTDEISTFDLMSIDTSVAPDPLHMVEWFVTAADELSDTPIPDPTMYQNFPLTPGGDPSPQTILARITSEFGCVTVVTVTLTVLPNPTPVSPSPLEECDVNDNGVADFTLADKDPEIIGGEIGVNVSYYLTLAEAQAGAPGTELPPVFPSMTQTVHARVTRDLDPPTSPLPCFTVVPLELVVVPLPDAPLSVLPDGSPGFQDPLFSCDTDGDTLAIFDLTLQDDGVLGAQLAAGFETVSYHLDQADALAGLNPILPADNYTSAGEQLWARLTSLSTGCTRATPFDLVVGTFPDIMPGDDLFLCDHEDGTGPNDGLAAFDLTLNTPLITNGDGLLQVEYFASAADQLSGSAISTPLSYQNEAAGQQEIFFTVTNPEGCEALGSFTVTVEANPIAGDPAPLVICDEDNDGLSTFDLTAADTEVMNGEPDVTVAYYETFFNAVDEVSPIADFTSYPNTVPFDQVVYARLERMIPPPSGAAFTLGCFSVVALELRVEPLPDAPVPVLPDGSPGFQDTLSMCDDDTDMVAVFDLTQQAPGILGAQDPSLFLPITYHESLGDAQSGTANILAPSAYPNMANPQEVWARLENAGTGCFRISSFMLRR